MRTIDVYFRHGPLDGTQETFEVETPANEFPFDDIPADLVRDGSLYFRAATTLSKATYFFGGEANGKQPVWKAGAGDEPVAGSSPVPSAMPP